VKHNVIFIHNYLLNENGQDLFFFISKMNSGGKRYLIFGGKWIIWPDRLLECVSRLPVAINTSIFNLISSFQCITQHNKLKIFFYQYYKSSLYIPFTFNYMYLQYFFSRHIIKIFVRCRRFQTDYYY
jgi:hypothetical protein